MKNKKITRKISQGVYVLTCDGGGCVVDAVSQVSSGENPLIAVAVMKRNFTNELMHESKTFALSVLSRDVSPQIIDTFGLKSMRDIDKFEEVETRTIEGSSVIGDSLGYMICEKVDTIENDTHTLFIGKLVEADVYRDDEPMTYAYYQENKDDFVKVETENGKTAWVCRICGFIYYGEELPEEFKCPICGVDKDMFEKK